MKRKNKDTTPETEESAKAIRREKAFSSFYAILLILTLVLTMGYCTFKQFKIERDDAYASLHNSMYSLRSLISFEGGMEDAFAKPQRHGNRHVRRTGKAVLRLSRRV